MKNNIMGFDQEKLLKLETKIDLSDLMLLDYIQFALARPGMIHEVDDNGISYVWLSHSKILEDLPLLDIKESMLKKRLSKLTDVGLITSLKFANKANKGTRSYYTITIKCEELMYDDSKCKKLYEKNQASVKNYTSYNTLSNTDNKLKLSKDNINKNSGKSDFIGSAKKSKQPSLYSRCMNQIDNFILKNKIPTNSTRIRDLLATHLDIAFESKSIRGEKQYVGILNKLQQLVDEGDKYQPVIQYSIEHGYPTFYSQKSKQKKYSSSVINSESGKRHVESFTKEDERRLNEFQKECKKKGIRTTF